MIAIIIIKLVASRINKVGLHRGWSETSLFPFALLMDERRGSMRPSSTSHMCKAPNILQANSDDTVMSKMGVRRKFYKPSINPRQGFSPNNGGKSA